MTAGHDSASRTLGFALTLGNTTPHWFSLAKVWDTRLNRAERSNILVTAIATAERDDAVTLMVDALEYFSAGQPLPAFTTFVDEARYWVLFTSLPERKHYMAAIWHTLSLADQTAFWQSLKARAA